MKVSSDQIRDWLKTRNLQEAMGKSQVEILTEFANTDFLVPPKPKQPHSRVTVWDETIKNGQTYHNLKRIQDVCWRYDYTFNGLPDVDKVIKETLDEGALAVRIECDGQFTGRKTAADTMCLFQKKVRLGWDYGDYYGSYSDLSSEIESSIIEYCKEQSAKQPKQPEPKFKVGDKAILNDCNAYNDIEIPQTVTLLRYDRIANRRIPWLTSANNGQFHAKESWLSPLPEPKFKANEWYQWNGVHQGTARPEKPQKIMVDRMSKLPPDRIYILTEMGEEFGVSESSLSLLSEMYVGKEWVLEQEGNPWDGMLVKCVREDKIYKEYEQYLYGLHHSVAGGNCYPEANIFDHDKAKPYSFIIQCIDPEFWTGILLGYNVRGYENDEGGVTILYDSDKGSGKWSTQDSPNFRNELIKYAIKKAGIPIMPYSQTNGQYDAPTKGDE